MMTKTSDHEKESIDDVDLRSSLLTLDKTNMLVVYSLNRRLSRHPFLRRYSDSDERLLKR